MSYDCKNVLLFMFVWKIKDVFGSFFIFIRFFYIHIYYKKLNAFRGTPHVIVNTHKKKL